MNNIINNKIKELKQQQINTTKANNKKLESEIKKILVSIIAILSSLYLKYDNASRNLQKVKVLKELEKELTKYKKQLDIATRCIIYDSLYNNFQDTYNKHVELLRQYNKLEVDKNSFSKVDIDKIIQKKFYGKTLNKRIGDNNDLIMNKTYKTVTDSLKKDTPLDGILKDVNTIFGITAIGMGERLLDTENTRIFSEAQNKALEDSNTTHLIWCADLCENTCDYCAGNDNQIFPIDDKPEIPAHANCNCYWEIV